MNAWDIDPNYALPLWREILTKLRQLQYKPAPHRATHRGTILQQTVSREEGDRPCTP